MKQRIVVGLMFCSFCLPAMAQEHCASIDNPDDRLNCYDQAMRTTETPETEGDWRVQVDTSKLDDTTTVVMTLNSENSVPGRFGGSDTGTMIARCKENTTSVYFVWAGHFMADIQGNGRVDYRLDDRPAQRRNMDVSTDNEALGLWTGGTAIPFLKGAFGASTLYVRATPFSDSPVEMTFNISGLDTAIAPLREACGW